MAMPCDTLTAASLSLNYLLESMRLTELAYITALIAGYAVQESAGYIPQTRGEDGKCTQTTVAIL